MAGIRCRGDVRHGLGEDHFKTMRNFAKRIVLAYDADKAGQSAAASVYQWNVNTKLTCSLRICPRADRPNWPSTTRSSEIRRRRRPLFAIPIDRSRGANLPRPKVASRAEHAMEVLAEHRVSWCAISTSCKWPARCDWKSHYATTGRELARNPKARTANEPPPITWGNP